MESARCYQAATEVGGFHQHAACVAQGGGGTVVAPGVSITMRGDFPDQLYAEALEAVCRDIRG